MTRFTLLLFVALLGGADRLAAQEKVEARGITSVIKLEEVTFGHLTELNGKFKMRATEFRFTRGLPWSASPYWARGSIYSFWRAHVH